MPSLTRSPDEHAEPVPGIDRERYGFRRESTATARPQGCRCSARDMSVVGYVRQSGSEGTPCRQPLRVVCRSCDGVEFWPCNCSSAVKCPSCAERKRRLLARIVDHGMTDRVGKGYTYLLTVTAPGESEHRQWIRNARGRRPECACHDNGLSMAEWNARESSCWNRLRLGLDRLTDGSLTFIGAVETQTRGALHRHVVINVDRPLLPDEVQDLAMAAGYGCVYDLALATSAKSVAGYISKYVTKSSSDRPEVPWLREKLDRRTGELVRSSKPTYRAWSSAQSWGFTMKGLREIARVQARARAEHLRQLDPSEDRQPCPGDVTAIDSRDQSPP